MASMLRGTPRAGSATSARPGCVTRELPREGRRVSLTGPVGGHTDTAHLCIRHPPPGAGRAPILRTTQGTRQERQARRWEQLSTGESGCWEGEVGRPPLRASVSPAGVRGEDSVRPWPWQHEWGARAVRP